MLKRYAVLGQDDQVIAVELLLGPRLVPQIAVGGERDLHLVVDGLAGLEVDQADAVVDHRDQIGRAAVLVALRDERTLLLDRRHAALLPPFPERLERGAGHLEMVRG